MPRRTITSLAKCLNHVAELEQRQVDLLCLMQRRARRLRPLDALTACKVDEGESSRDGNLVAQGRPKRL